MIHKQLAYELGLIHQRLQSSDPMEVDVLSSSINIKRAMSDLAAVMTYVRELEVKLENAKDSL